MNVSSVIEVEDLVVEYGKRGRRVRAVDSVSLHVDPGECVGFIGVNGAGKSSTIKTLMGFHFPRNGSVRGFGERAGTPKSRQRIGYLPEVAHYYPFMTARDLLDLYGDLMGLGAAGLRARIPYILERVGLHGKGETQLKHFSKGMQQRLGIAQALIADPELLIFDELSSGLDPLGRHNLREVLQELKSAGRTIFFSSHELTEVETLCDRIVVIHRGRIVRSEAVADLMKPLNLFEVTFGTPNGAGLPGPVSDLNPHPRGDAYRLVLADAAAYSSALARLTATGCPILETTSRSQSIEDYFISLVGAEETGA